jgi:hypothetical protein
MEKDLFEMVPVKDHINHLLVPPELSEDNTWMVEQNFSLCLWWDLCTIVYMGSVLLMQNESMSAGCS